MKRVLCLVVASVAGVAAAASLAAPGSARVATGSTKAARVSAVVDVQIVRRPHGLTDWTQFGSARITVTATDNDPSAPDGSVPQPADEGSIGCEPAGSPQCAIVATGPISWIRVDGPHDVTISSGGFLMWLHDGGNPGSRETGTTSGSGDAETVDFLTLGDWGGFATFDGWVRAGKVRIQTF